jgi:7-cyano-7-deazaguanine synthase
VEIKTPLIKLHKSQIVELGAQLKIPFELSWSCYQDNELACGECDSCVLRLRAFREAGLKDPIPYKK